MKKTDFVQYINDTYDIEGEFPWSTYPDYMVFRHDNNKKWFAVIMDITGDKLGLDAAKRIDVVNVKCDPISLGSFIDNISIFPAYHMNKNNWISVILDENTDDEKLKMLLDISFDLTNKKGKK